MARCPSGTKLITVMSEEVPLNLCCFQRTELGYFPQFL